MGDPTTRKGTGSSDRGCVIVGGGQGGFQTALSLRDNGWTDPITLFCQEPVLPYQRPPLSKAYLLDQIDEDRLYFRDASFYAERDINVQQGVTVTALDRDRKQVTLSDGNMVGYTQLVLATGSKPVSLPYPEAKSPSDAPQRQAMGIWTLRTLEDSAALRRALHAAEKIVVVGAGYIGLEFAAVCSKMGKSVVVVEAASHVLSRTASPYLADFLQRYHRMQGVEVLLGSGVRDYHVGDHGRVSAVSLSDGSAIPADMVIEGVGARGVTSLAEQAALECENGITVRTDLRTNDPAIYAVGDVANFYSARYGQRLRLESVQNAIDQGKACAAAILGQAVVYDPVPWFWTDQYALKVQMAGIGAGATHYAVRGELPTGLDETISEPNPSFSVFAFREDRLVAVEAVNRPLDYMVARKLMEAHKNPTVAQVESLDVDLKAMLK